MNVYPRMQVYEALVGCLGSRATVDWSESALTRFIVFLHRMMMNDDHVWITHGAAQTLQDLLRTYRGSISNYWADTLKRERPVSLEQIRENVDSKLEDTKR